LERERDDGRRVVVLGRLHLPQADRRVGIAQPLYGEPFESSARGPGADLRNGCDCNGRTPPYCISDSESQRTTRRNYRDQSPRSCQAGPQRQSLIGCKRLRRAWHLSHSNCALRISASQFITART
jgi:hypothetical protein